MKREQRYNLGGLHWDMPKVTSTPSAPSDSGAFLERTKVIQKTSVTKMSVRFTSLFKKLYWRAGFDLYKFVGLRKGIPLLWWRPFDHLPLFGVGAEIGVYRGLHAAELLRRHSRISELWLVDGYTRYSGPGEPPLLLEAERAAHRLLQPFSQRVRWLRTPSPHCADDLPMLDFCYIDAAHDYEAVQRDIQVLWPRIKAGGILGGHDFEPDFTGLIRAVAEFSIHNELELFVHSPDWWLIKKGDEKLQPTKICRPPERDVSP